MVHEPPIARAASGGTSRGSTRTGSCARYSAGSRSGGRRKATAMVFGELVDERGEMPTEESIAEGIFWCGNGPRTREYF